MLGARGCNVYSALYYVLQGFGVSPPWLLIPWGLESNQVLLRAPAYAYIPAFVLPSLS
jgi:hypothetical protein